MNKNKELAKNTMILTMGKLCTQFVSFLLLPLYTEILNANDYGVVDLFTTYVSLLMPVVCFQLDQGLFRFMIEKRNDTTGTKRLFSSLFIIVVAQVVLFSVLFGIVSFFITSEYKIYLLLNVILSVLSSFLMQFARGLGKMMIYSISSFITATSTVLFNVWFLVGLNWGAAAMFRATLMGLLINVVYLFITLEVYKYVDFALFNKSTVSEVLKYSIPLIPNQISGWVLSASDRTIVSFFLGIGFNGLYAIAYKFSGLVATFYGFFNMAWVETVSLHFHEDDRDEYLTKTIQSVLVMFASGCLGIIAIMPFAFPLMINSKFNDAYFQIPILLVAVVFQILVGLLSAIYLAEKKSMIIAKTTILGAIINIIVHLALVSNIGLYAASISTFISYAVVALYRAYDIRKFVKIKWNKNLIISLLLVFAITLVAYYLKVVVLQVLALIIVILYALFINREILGGIRQEGFPILNLKRK